MKVGKENYIDLKEGGYRQKKGKKEIRGKGKGKEKKGKKKRNENWK